MPIHASWRSLHLFYGHPEDADALVRFAAGILRDLTPHMGDWFFIRYPEAGVHVRMRIGDQAQQVFDAFRSAMTSRCAELADDRPISAWAKGVGHPDARGRLFDPGATVEIDYEPEVQRYGGAIGLIENERLFRVSTAVATRAIDATFSALPRRAGLATDLMLMAAAAIADAGADPAAFFTRYTAMWRKMWPDVSPAGASAVAGGPLRPRFERHRDFIASGRAPESLIDFWGHELSRARARLTEIAEQHQLVSPISGGIVANHDDLARAITDIGCSQIHMLNNRLGFWPPVEIALSETIAARLSL